MAKLKLFTILVALLLAGGEMARWWGNPRFLPLAFDELLVGCAMLAAALSLRRLGPAPLAVAWGLFCGLTLSLLMPTLDHLLFGPEKASGAVFYSVTLSVMLGVGLLALWASLKASLQAGQPQQGPAERREP